MSEVLIVGEGGREHALGWKLAQSPHVHSLHFAPGNAGTLETGTNVASHISQDIDQLAEYAAGHADFTIFSSEEQLAAGAVDAFKKRGLTAFGPTQAPAQLESSKAYAADAKKAFGVPSPEESHFDSIKAARKYVDYKGWGNTVIKADGPAQGKGAVVPDSAQEADETLYKNLVEYQFGESSRRVVIQERLEGPELSWIILADGERWVTLPPTRDYKRLKDGNRGPNTGGMGSYGPIDIDPELTALVDDTIVRPTIEGMAERGEPFRGILYTGLILTKDGPKVIEYNVRFGDPETQVQMMLIDEDFYVRLQQAATGDLDTNPLRLHPGHAVSVALAAPGYPGKPHTGSVIQGLDKVDQAEVFHAGTSRDNGAIRTAGGRVLHIAAYGETLSIARANVYRNIGKGGIHFAKKHYRRDIAKIR